MPKKQDIGATNKLIKAAKEKEAKEHHFNGAEAKPESENDVSALEQLVTMGGGDNPRLLHEQTNEQEETILHQVEDRPLLQKQKELDAEDDPESNESPSVEEAQDLNKHRHHLLEDHDRELFQLQDRLEQVHSQFFDEYDRKRSHALGGRVAALRGDKTPSKDKDVDLKLVPDIKDIMQLFKQRVLGGVVLVFSGVLPLDADTQNADISLWAKSFGVVIASKINGRTTHLVAGRNRTAKVREATRYPNVKIVTTQWLLDSLVNWQHLDEDPYLLPVHPDDRGEPLSPNSREFVESSWISSEDEATPGSMWTDDEGNAEMFRSAGLTETSHLGFDEDEQAAIHDELKDFLGSDDESESDNEAMDEETNTASKKRKRGEGNTETDEESAEDDDDDDDETDKKGSRLSQRIKRSYERNTGLREVATASSSEMGETRAEPVRSNEDEPNENPDDDEDELEREMLAAFEDDFDDNAEPEGDDVGNE